MTRERLRWQPAYIGIGSNLEQPIDHVERAFGDLAEIPESRVVYRSGLYRSAPVGPEGQPDYINAAAGLLTCLSAQGLLAALQEIENAHGRNRDAERWGPRTLDLDLLVFSDLQIETPKLTLPHPRIAERNFVLLPLREFAPDLRVPGLATVRRLSANLEAGAENARIEKITSNNP